MIMYFYAFANDLILDNDFEQWLYEKLNDIEHFVDSDMFYELYECDYQCSKALNHLKRKISQYYENQFIVIKNKKFYDEIDNVLLDLVKRCERKSIINGKLVINCAEISTPIELQKMLKSIFKFPHWYGLNWNAFNDLIDLSEVEGIALLNFNRIQKLIPYDAEKLLFYLEQNKSQNCEIEIIM